MSRRPLLPLYDTPPSPSSAKRTQAAAGFESPRAGGIKGVIRTITNVFARGRIKLARQSTPRKIAILVASVTFLLVCIWQLFSDCILCPSLYFALYPTPVDPSSSVPTAWMDWREQRLIETTINGMRASSDKPLRMLEYGSGYSTFHFSKMVDAYYSIEHDMAFCSGLYDLARRAHVPDGDLEIWRLTRDVSDGSMVATRWDDRPAPSNPRIHIYCIAPSADQVRTEHSSWLNSWLCCFRRCPSKAAMFEEYMRVPSWIEQLKKTQRVSPEVSERRITPETAAIVRPDAIAARDVFPFPESTSTTPFLYDVVLVDGRARPQCAWFVWSLLSQRGRTILHDWNRRRAYHEVLQVYRIVDQQVESTQPGGGGLVILERKTNTQGALTTTPTWWLGGEDTNKQQQA